MREARTRQRQSDAERHYQAGLRALDGEDYRGAYDSFGRALALFQDFRDARTLRALALERGRIRAAVFPFRNATHQYGLEEQIYAYVLSNAVNQNDPFIELVDPDRLRELERDSPFRSMDFADPTRAARYGQRLEARAIVMASLITAHTSSEGINRSRERVWEVYLVTDADGKEVIRGRPVEILIGQGSKTTTVKVQYQVVEVATARVINSGVLEDSFTDEVSFAEYDGDPSTLWFYNPAGQRFDTFLATDFVLRLLTGESMSGQLNQAPFHARKRFLGVEEMTSQLAERIGAELARQFMEDIRSYRFAPWELAPPPDLPGVVSAGQSDDADADGADKNDDRQRIGDSPSSRIHDQLETDDDSADNSPGHEFLTVLGVTGSYVEATGASTANIPPMTEVLLLDDRGEIVAEGMLISIAGDEATIEIRTVPAGERPDAAMRVIEKTNRNF